MATIVSMPADLTNMLSRCLTCTSGIGEILEKATRVLTDAEKAQMEVEFVGKNGQRRKLEVTSPLPAFIKALLIIRHL